MGDALVACFEFLLLASVYCLVTLPRARNQYSVRGSDRRAWRPLSACYTRVSLTVWRRTPRHACPDSARPQAPEE
jgi:hypothetical protein